MGIRVLVRKKTRCMQVRFGWLGGGALALGAFPVLVNDPRLPSWLSLSGIWLASLAVFWLVYVGLGWLEAHRITKLEGASVVDRAGLVMGAYRVFSRSEVRHAFVVDAVTVRVVTQTHDYEIACEAGGAEYLLSTMQLDGSESLGYFVLRRNPWRGFRHTVFVGVMMAGGLLLSVAHGLQFHYEGDVFDGIRLAPLTFLYMMAWAALLLRRVPIVVGNDGVRWGRDFIAFSEIRGVQLTRTDIILELRDGTAKKAHFHHAESRAFDAYPMRDEAASLVRRIQSRIHALRVRGHRIEADVSQLRCEVASYRVQGMPTDAAWRIAEDGSYARELRLEAVATLDREPLNAADLRAIVEASADPELSNVLNTRSATR